VTQHLTEKVVPMIHVPDVRAAAGWYESIGFTVTRANWRLYNQGKAVETRPQEVPSWQAASASPAGL
jgi:hypothetical protein